eukprot:765437-Hanusia_phi.AAC.2
MTRSVDSCKQREYCIMADDEDKDFLETLNESSFHFPSVNMKSETAHASTTDAQTARPPLRFVRGERRSADSSRGSQECSAQSRTSFRRARNRQIGRELAVAQEAHVIPFRVLHIKQSM